MMFYLLDASLKYKTSSLHPNLRKSTLLEGHLFDFVFARITRLLKKFTEYFIALVVDLGIRYRKVNGLKLIF